MITQRKSYQELSKLETLHERFEYLKLTGSVGTEIFGANRYLNQNLYTSKEWKNFRKDVIIRDNACEFGLEPYDIPSGITVHHINPLTEEDIENNSDKIFDMNNVVCMSANMHRAVHYGDINYLNTKVDFTTRTKDDTKLW